MTTSDFCDFSHSTFSAGWCIERCSSRSSLWSTWRGTEVSAWSCRNRSRRSEWWSDALRPLWRSGSSPRTRAASVAAGEVSRHAALVCCCRRSWWSSEANPWICSCLVRRRSPLKAFWARSHLLTFRNSRFSLVYFRLNRQHWAEARAGCLATTNTDYLDSVWHTLYGTDTFSALVRFNILEDNYHDYQDFYCNFHCKWDAKFLEIF